MPAKIPKPSIPTEQVPPIKAAHSVLAPVKDKDQTLETANSKLLFTQQEQNTSKLVGSYLERYLLAVKADGCSSSTIRNYRSDIKQFFEFVRFDEIEALRSKPKLLAFAQAQKDKGLAEASIKRKLTSLTQFKLWLKKEGLIRASEVPLAQKSVEVVTNTTEVKSERTPKDITKISQEKIQKVKPNSSFFQSRFLLGINILAVIIFLAGLGYFAYQQFGETLLSYAYPSTPTRGNRILSYQGRLTDTAQSPINAATEMSFKLFDADTGGTELWSSNTCTIDPDQDGIFSVNLGAGAGIGADNESCGAELGDGVFTENANVWLEVTVGSGSMQETLSPRQPIRTVAYAINAETLQGLPPAEVATANTVPVMNSSGEIVLGGSTPAIKTDSASAGLTIESKAINLITSSGSNGDITLSPDGNGQVEVSSANLLVDGYLKAAGATFSGTYAGSQLLSLQGASGQTGNYLQWLDSSSNILGVIDESGNLGLGVSSPSYKLDVSGDINLTGALRTSGNAGSNGQILTSTGSGLAWTDASTVGTNYWQRTAGSLAPINTSDSLNLGASATASATVHLAGTSGENSFINTGKLGIGTTSPSALLHLNNTSGSAGMVINAATSNNAYIDFQENGTLKGNIWLDGANDFLGINATTYNTIINKNSGNVGIGNITSPQAQLHIYNSSTASLMVDSTSTRIDWRAGTNIDAQLGRSSTSSNANILYANSKTFGTSKQWAVGLRPSNSDYHIYSDANSFEALTVQQSGNVGISNVSPSYKLDVTGDINTTTTYRIGGVDYGQYFIDGAGTSGQIWTSDGVGRGTWQDAPSSGTTYSFTNGLTESSGTVKLGGALTENTTLTLGNYNQIFDMTGTGNFDVQSSGTSKFFVENDGKVGIGTNTPSEQLDIASGKLNFSAGTTDTSIWGSSLSASTFGELNIQSNAANTSTVLRIFPKGTAAAQPSANLQLFNTDWAASQTNYESLEFRFNSNVAQLLSTKGGTGTVRPIQIATGSNTGMYMNASGYTGFGTTSPIQPLHVVSAAGGFGNNSTNGAAAQFETTSTGNTAITTSWKTGSAYSFDIMLFAAGASPANAVLLDQRNNAPLMFLTNNSTRMTILGGGNVGIGTTSPGYLLDTAGDINTTTTYRIGGVDYGQYFINSAGTSGQIWTSDGSGRGVWQAAPSGGSSYTFTNGLTESAGTVKLGGALTENTTLTLGNYNQIFNMTGTGNFDVQSSGTSKFFVQNDGKVGIGTNAPGAQVDIAGTTPVLRLTNTEDKTWTLGDVMASLEFYSADNSGNFPAVATAIKSVVESTYGNSQGLAFFTANDASSPTERLRINRNGYLGIGTSDPSTVLNVVGGTGLLLQDVTGNSSNKRGLISGAHYSTAEENITLMTIDSTSDSNFLRFGGGPGSNQNAANYVTFFTAATNTTLDGTERMRIDNSGNVGIGTSSPTAKLHVSGGNILHSAAGNPTLAGSYDTSGNALDVDVIGKYAYIADFSAGLQIIDVSNPSSPSLVGTYDTSGSARGVSVTGKYAYVADDTAGLQIIDVSNPSSPSLVGTYNTSGNSYSVSVAGKYAYVADSASGLQIIDVSNPSSPSLVGTYDTSGTAFKLTILDKYAYVADAASGLQILDVSNPSSPSLVSTFNTGNTAYDVGVAGKYAYVADSTDGLRIIDVSNPSSPSLVGTYDTSGSAKGVSIAGKYAYVADNLAGLQVIDVSNPSSPSLVGTYGPSAGSLGIVVAGKYAYVADSTDGLRIIDINGTETPAISTGSLNTNNLVADGDVSIGNSLSIRNGLNIGTGGLLSSGAATFQGDVSIAGTLFDSTYSAGTSGNVLTSTGTGTVWSDLGSLSVGNSDTTDSYHISGSANYLSKFNSSNDSLVDSVLYESSGNIGLGTITPSYRLAIQGSNSGTTLGSTLLTNGNFATNSFTGWTAGSNWSAATGKAVHTAGSTATLYQAVSLTSGTTYQIDLTQSGASAGSVTISVGSMFSTTVGTTDTSRTFSFTANATGSQNFVITPTSDYNGSLDDFAIRPVTGTSTAEFALLNSDGSLGWEARSGGSALHNIFVGTNSGITNTNGTNNSSLGYNSLSSNTSGNYNNAFGSQTLKNNTYGSNNAAVGYSSLFSNISGSTNSALGNNSLYSNTSGSSNTAIGFSSLYNNTTGYYNSALGSYSLYSNTSGQGNIAIGNNALYSNNASYNSAIGYGALYSNTSGTHNNAIGTGSLYGNTTGNANNAIGFNSLYSNTTGTSNEAFGDEALFMNTSGNGNVAFGDEALHQNSTADFNTAVGTGSLFFNNGSNNTAIGFSALGSATGANQNVALGFTAGYNNLTGTGNVFLGYQAGYNETGSNKLYIANSSTNPPLIYGDFSTARVGIGTTSPAAGLDVVKTHTSTGDFIASRVEANRATSGTLTLFGYRTLVNVSHTSGTLTGAQANSTQLNFTGNGGTTSYAEGLTSNASISTGAIVSNLSMIRVYSPSNSGTITHLKGLYLQDMSAGSSTNYSIYSEGGTMYHAGSVGIGTTNPGSLLQVGGAGSSQIAPNLSGTGNVAFAASNQLLTFGLSNASPWASWIQSQSGTGGTLPISINPLGGNVGIGTTSPELKLTVSGTSGFPATSGTTQTGILRLANSGSQVLDMGQNNATGTAWLQSTSSSNLAANWALVLNPNGGNVGIGTTSPTSKLHLSDAGSVDLLIEADTDNATESDQPSLTLSQDGGAVLGKLGYFSSTNILTLKNVFNDGLNFGTNDTIWMTILNSGNVGVGTATPATLFSIDQSANDTIPALGSAGGRFSMTAYGAYGLIGGVLSSGNAFLQVQRIDGNAISYNMLLQPNAGYVGIGTTSPAQRFDVTGGSTILSYYLYLRDYDDQTTNVNMINRDGALHVRNGGLAVGSYSNGGSSVGQGYLLVQNDITAGNNINATNNVNAAGTVAYSAGLELNLGGTGNRISHIDFHTDDTYTDYGFRIYRSSGANGEVQLLQRGTGRIVAQSNTGGVQLTNGATSWTSNSDIRLKNVTSYFDNAIADLMTLNPIHFTWKSDPDGKAQVGLIAQEVQQIMPEIVDINPDGYLGVRYTEMIPLLVAGIKEQQLQIQQLDSQVATINSLEGLGNSEQPATLQLSPTDLDLATLTPDQSSELLATTDISLVDAANNTITALANYASLTVGKLQAGLIAAQNVITQNLVADRVKTEQLLTSEITANSDQLTLEGNTVAIQLNDATDQENPEATNSSKLGTLLVQNQAGEVVASLDSQGNASLSGELTVEGQTKLGSLLTQDATVSGTLAVNEIEAQSARINQIESQLASLQDLQAENATFGQASVSGTLYSDHIEAGSISAGAIEGLQERLSAQIAATLSEPSLLASLISPAPASDTSYFDEVSQDLGATNSATTTLQNVESMDLVADSALIQSYFEVDGNALIQTLQIAQQLNIGQSISLADNYLAFTPENDADPTFYIQPSGQGRISLLAGLMTLDESGLAIINGDLKVAGSLEVAENLQAKGSLLTDLIKSSDPGSNIQVQLAQTATNSATLEESVQESQFQFVDANNNPVASVSAQGDLTLQGGLNIAQEASTTATTKSAGQATLMAGTTSIIIETTRVTDHSMIYITPLGSTKNQVLYVKAKVSENPETPENEGQFTVALDSALEENLSFNWWIVN